MESIWEMDTSDELREGVRRPHWTLQPGRPQEKHEKDRQYGMPTMPRAWPDVFGGVHEAENGERANLPGLEAEEVGLPRLRGGGRSGVATDAPSEP